MLACSGLEKGDGRQIAYFGILADFETPLVGKVVFANPLSKLHRLKLYQSLHKQHEKLFSETRLLV